MKHSFWHLDLFGGLRAVRVDQPEALPIENFRTQKAASLLAFLAFYRQAHRREVLAEMFWPEAEPLNARNSLRVALSGLREQLEVEGKPEESALIVKRESLTIAPTVSTDVALFRSRLQDAHFEVDAESRLNKLEAAVELVRGPLLRGFYDDWISGEAARLEDEFLSALRQIITAYEHRKELSKALDAARRGTIAAPLREGVVRDLVRLGFACGQEENVKSEFEAYRRRVERVGGAPPVEWSEFLRRATQTNASLTPLTSAETAPALPTTKTWKKEVVASKDATPISSRSLSSAPRVAAWHPAPEAVKPVPRSASSFIGRERDMEDLIQLLESPATRLVTITGPGGAGKTRLAQETVRFLTNPASGEETAKKRLPFGVVIWLPLASLPSSRLLPGALLDAIGAPAFKEDIEAVALMLRQLSDASRNEFSVAGASTPQVTPRLLLLIDNCEHLDKSAALFVDDLLARVPTLTVLATSRSALSLGGEHVSPLASLDATQPIAPRNAIQALTSKTLLSAPSDAVRLFAERARQARPQFQLTVTNTALASKICEHLDGLPLAIEIVAARVAQFSLEQIATGLGVEVPPGNGFPNHFHSSNGAKENGNSSHDSLTALGQGIAPDADDLIRSLGLLDWANPNVQAPTRHSSLRAAIEWSADQLSPTVARFWSRLSVFQESFSLEAAIEVCEEPYASVYLQTLRDASLLTVTVPGSPATGLTASGTENTRETTRIVWLHALREFAEDVLPAADKMLLEARHASYFLQWTLQMRSLLDNPSTTREQRLLDAEAVNLRAALHWLLEHDVEGALRLANALCWHWEQAGHLIEGRLAVETALERSGEMFAALEAQVRDAQEPLDIAQHTSHERLRERAQALEGAGKMATMVSDHEAVGVHLTEALRLFRLLNDESGIASCLYAMGFNALRRGDHENAKKLCQESLEITRRLDDPVLLSDALYNLSIVAVIAADYPTVRQLSAERLALCRANGDRRGLAMSLENLGLAALFAGEPEAATYFSECLTAFEALEDKPSVARALWGLGQVALYSERLDEARDSFLRSSALMRATHNLWAIPYLLESFGALAVAQNQWGRAAVLLGGAANLRERQSEPLLSSQHQAEFELLCERARLALGTQLFDQQWQKGYALERTQLLNLAESLGD